MTTTATEPPAVRTATRFHRVRYGGTRALCGVPVGFAVESLPVADVPDADRCRRCWGRPEGARLERSSMAQRQGIRATADGGVCDRCDQPILKDQRIVKRESTAGEHWIHAGCYARDHQ